MRWIKTVLLVSVCFLQVGCSLFGDGERQKIKINNSSSEQVLISVWDLETSHTLDIDIAPVVPVEGTSFHPIDADESINYREKEIEGDYSSGDNTRLLLYEVEGDSAYSKGLFDMSADVRKVTVSKEGDDYYYTEDG